MSQNLRIYVDWNAVKRIEKMHKTTTDLGRVSSCTERIVSLGRRRYYGDVKMYATHRLQKSEEEEQAERGEGGCRAGLREKLS